MSSLPNKYSIIIDLESSSNPRQQIAETKGLIKSLNIEDHSKNLLCKTVDASLKSDFEDKSAVVTVCSAIKENIKNSKFKLLKEPVLMESIEDIIVKEFSPKEDVLKIVQFFNGVEKEFWIGIPNMASDTMELYADILFDIQDYTDEDFEFRIVGINHFEYLNSFSNIKVLYSKEGN